jgi:hypothetical protein
VFPRLFHNVSFYDMCKTRASKVAVLCGQTGRHAEEGESKLLGCTISRRTGIAHPCLTGNCPG